MEEMHMNLNSKQHKYIFFFKSPVFQKEQMA